MSDILTMLMGDGARPDACRHGIPNRVNLSISFVAMMRQTASRAAYEGSPAVDLDQLPEERGAYAAALECLRTYFNGENFGPPVSAVHGADDGPPAGPVPAPETPPLIPVPAGAR